MLILCKICGSEETAELDGVASNFFAQRALGCSGNLPVKLIYCRSCKSRWFNIDVSDSQLNDLYKDYRGAAYFELRNKYEPWYTAEINKNLKVNYIDRRKRLLTLFNSHGIPNSFNEVLDHGGDAGQLVTGIGESVINSKKRYVYDISGARPLDDVESIDTLMLSKINPDLILSCHVLEHLANPLDYLKDLVAIGRNKTLFYIEVPQESYFSLNSNFIHTSSIMNFISKRQGLFMFFHFHSILFRRYLKILPPPFFHVLNEHINFFSSRGLESIILLAGLTIKISGTSNGSIFIIAEKS